MKIGDYYDLEENIKSIVSKKEENGYENQYFTKENFKWVVFDIDEEKGEILLISEEPSEQELILNGQVGYENAEKVIDNLCKEITGLENARNLKFEDIINSKYWEEEKKKELIFKDNTYWLSSRCVNAYGGYANFGVRYVTSSNVYTSKLFYSDGDKDSDMYLVRPVVSVKMEGR